MLSQSFFTGIISFIMSVRPCIRLSLPLLKWNNSAAGGQVLVIFRNGGFQLSYFKETKIWLKPDAIKRHCIRSHSCLC